MDLSEGSLLWLKIGILTVSGALVPLLVPRKYSPVNPKVANLHWPENGLSY